LPIRGQPKRATIRSIVRFSPTSHTMLTER
jgi:hypothetical protein